jgi:hypothetical protein
MWKGGKEVSGSLDAAKEKKLGKALSELIDIEAGVRKTITSYTILPPNELIGIRDKVKEWLAKALEIAREFSPKEFNIGVRIGPIPDVHVSFTWDWSEPSKSEKEQ